MELISTGTDYEYLPDSYVIFICDFDPIGDGLYRYVYRKTCEETGDVLEDGTCTIFLSSKGTNPEDVPPELVKFLEYVSADLEHSEDNFEDAFVGRLQNSVRRIKTNREMEELFMTLEEMLKDEYEEGLKEGHSAGLKEGHSVGQKDFLLFILKEKYEFSEYVSEIIRECDSEETLRQWAVHAISAETLEQFMELSGLLHVMS